MFTLKVDATTTLQIALVRFLKSLERNDITGYIHASESSDYRFVTTKCFVRSVFAHSPSSDYPRYVINDLIDQDSYIRLENQ